MASCLSLRRMLLPRMLEAQSAHLGEGSPLHSTLTLTLTRPQAAALSQWRTHAAVCTWRCWAGASAWD